MKRLILYIAGILFLAGCSTTKHLPEGEILYTGQKTMIVENRSKTPVGETAMEEVEAALGHCSEQLFAGQFQYPHTVPCGIMDLQWICEI